MTTSPTSRRNFLKLAGTVASAGLLRPTIGVRTLATHQ